jgi:hypothetical protein
MTPEGEEHRSARGVDLIGLTAEHPAAPEGAFVQVVDLRGHYSNPLEDLQQLLRDYEPLGG